MDSMILKSLNVNGRLLDLSTPQRHARFFLCRQP